MDRVEQIRAKYEILKDVLDEAAARVWAAAEAQVLGRGGITAVSKATGMGRMRIHQGLRDIAEARKKPVGEQRRVRKPGGGRKSLLEKDASLQQDLLALVEPTRRGDPMSPLCWTLKSLSELESALQERGHKVSRMTIGRLLKANGFSLQSARKTTEGSHHEDRDAQFQYIAESAKRFGEEGEPVISVDTKKKELVGDFKNAGQEWQPKGNPVPVRVHDFIDKDLGKAIPYGVYDVARNEGWVSVGTDHDTAEFSVATILRWWNEMGKQAYPNARKLLITADGGGSNGARVWLWKSELQKFADATGLSVTVNHYPPGTSKWNKIEHRMFCHITRNWRGRPLESVETVVNLISATKTKQGLRIRAAKDQTKYQPGRKVSKDLFRSLRILRDDFHGEWNYTISPA
jgi:transposase